MTKHTNKIIKRQHNIQKGNGKIRTSVDTVAKNTKHMGNKFIQMKRPETQHKNLYAAYEQMSYLEDFHKMHNNIEEMMKHKHNLKFEAKKKKTNANVKKSNKNKRSATPALSMAQGYFVN